MKEIERNREWDKADGQRKRVKRERGKRESDREGKRAREWNTERCYET